MLGLLMAIAESQHPPKLKNTTFVAPQVGMSMR